MKKLVYHEPAANDLQDIQVLFNSRYEVGLPCETAENVDY